MKTLLRQKAVSVSLAILACLALVPEHGFAQGTTGTIAGTVKDTTGAVLPGVTVEAASPALIEKVRTAVTDNAGAYRIVDLRPGVYTVTFTLPGFSAMKREGIELTAGFTANVTADLQVGAVAETITVSGQTPLVDVQNAVQHRTVTSALIEDLPSARHWINLAILVPGVRSTIHDVGGSGGDYAANLTFHGSRAGDMQLLWDGLRVNNIFGGAGGGQVGLWSLNAANVQEYSVDTGGSTAEVETSGVRANPIPKAGGNRFSFFFLANYSNDSLQSDNLTADLAARGGSKVATKKIYDYNPGVGGPVVKDKAWFYGAYRYWGATTQYANAYYPKDPAAYVYVPDLSRPAAAEITNKSYTGRLTLQTSRNSKLALYGDQVPRCICQNGLGLERTPRAQWAATTYQYTGLNSVFQANWNWTASNRLLVEISQNFRPENVFNRAQDGVPGKDAYSVIDSTRGVNFRAPGALVIPYNDLTSRQYGGRGQTTFVTGSHTLKVGTQWYFGTAVYTQLSQGDAFITTANDVPVTITLRATPLVAPQNLNLNLGTYVQEQWTHKRLTLNGGVRFEYINAKMPAFTSQTTRYVAGRDFAEMPNLPNWKDINPRASASYDVFGNGRTAVKWNLGRYVESVGTGIVQAIHPLQAAAPNQAARAWTDANRDFVPDCDLKNPVANGECGASTNASFGTGIQVLSYAPGLTEGWGKRQYNWETMAGIQHELRPGLSVDVSYDRRWFGNFRVTQNLLTTSADYSPFCVTAPVDARLPGGGGSQVCGLYDINPNKLGLVTSQIAPASKFGEQTDIWDSVDYSATFRRGRLQVQGGASTGRVRTNNCFVINSPQALLNCDIRPPFQTNTKLLVVYPLPWGGIQTSATYQDLPGPQILATYTAPAAAVSGLDRPLSGGARTVANVPLIKPGTLYGERLRQLDLRVSKIVRVRQGRVQGMVDFYNLLNGNYIVAQNDAYGPAWQTPTNIQQGRMFKFGVQVDF